MNGRAATGFWRTVWLLLKASRQRSRGRQQRQRDLLSNRSQDRGIDWSPLATIGGLVLMAILHGSAAVLIVLSVSAGQRVAAVEQGKIVVHSWFLADVRDLDDPAARSPDAVEAHEGIIADEAKDIAERDGGDPDAIERQLRASLSASGTRNLASRAEVEPGMSALATSGPGTVLGSVVLLWWLAMLVCQGEGLDLDLQRRRHPMWEWLLSHPVGAGAVFLSEMLSPIFSNPTYWAAPVFVAILFGSTYGPLVGAVAAPLIGIPLAVAAACAGKALEIGALLRLAPRSRGAVVGILAWFGYASMLAMFVGVSFLGHVLKPLSLWISRVGIAPWPVLGLFLGMGVDGGFSLARAVLFCWGISALMIVAAVTFSANSVRNGLAGAFAPDSIVSRPRGKARFGRDPLFRKELLWFTRDRSAIVQAVLIPLTVAAFQLFNLRFLVSHAGDSWNYLAGAAIFFGTYFLWVLGPKSLLSEGAALWIALTWPRGLESILKAKARLWSLLSTALVSPLFIAACWIFPQATWQIALVALGWFFFARSMAEKAVTLVTIVSESGEASKISNGQRWGAQLGMLTFAIGVCTQQWNLAIVGIVFSWITAAAMWENFRARLPYLYDPWSETLPEPPTLMHAMVSISILIECASIVTGTVYAIGGRESLGLAYGLGYGICAIAVSIGVGAFLDGRDVSPARIWGWREDDPDPDEREPWLRRYVAADGAGAGWLVAGIGGGIALALLAHAYLLAIQLIPSVAETMRASKLAFQQSGLQTAYAVIAIGFAPMAEEYLFRGLLFRALDRHWGGWKAVAAAAAFFAIYHPTLAWPPVLLVGAANCLLFKRSKRLAPAILLHMTYNALVVLWS